MSAIRKKDSHLLCTQWPFESLSEHSVEYDIEERCFQTSVLSFIIHIFVSVTSLFLAIIVHCNVRPEVGHGVRNTYLFKGN